LSKLKDLPAVPIRNISIQDSRDKNLKFKPADLKNLAKIVENFKESIDFVELRNFEFQSILDLQKTVQNLRKIQSIVLDHCRIRDADRQLQKFTHLKSISFHESDDDFFKIFHEQKSVEEISIVRMAWGNDFSWVDFDEMAKNFKSLNSLVLKGHGTGNYLEYGGYPFKIRKLDAFLMTFYWTNHDPRTRFLENHRGHLKELRLEKLPYDFDGGMVLKYIIEDMQLDTFYNGKLPLILGGRKQDVKEFRVQEVQIQSAYEMFRQFPSEFGFKKNL
jgi:hypothetical protein